MKALLYCNKKKPYLSVEYQQPSMFEPIGSWNVFTANKENECGKIVNGKIIAEIDYDVEDVACELLDTGVGCMPIYYTDTIDNIYSESCLSQYDL